MNTSVQILILCIIIPLCAQAKEETLEQRKQRIVRKYMRERAEVSQSELYVPSDNPVEDEQVIESEKYEGTKDLFERQETGSATMPIPRRPAMPAPRKKDNSNWLLDTEESDPASDPYADPFADPFALDKTKRSDARQDQSQWDRSRQESSSSTYGSSSQDSRYPRENSTYSPYGSRKEAESGTSVYGSSYGTRDESAYGRSSLYGSRERDASGTSGSRTYSPGVLGQDSGTYGSSPETGLLNSPYPTIHSSGQDSSRDSGSQGYGTDRSRSYTPSYRSPYGTSTDRQQGGNAAWGTPSSQSQQQQDYSQPSSFQKWKDKNKGFDPSSDDAYLREINPSQRR